MTGSDLRTMSTSKESTFRKFTQSISSIWDNFTTAVDRKTAKCKLCEKIIKTGGGSTSGLHTHMRTMHKNICNEISVTTASPAPSTSSASCASTSMVSTSTDEPAAKKVKLTDYFQSSDSMELVVSRMAALDGIPLSKFCTSKDLRRLFSKSGYNNLPKSPTTITNIILRQSDNVKNYLNKMLTDFKTKEHRFTLTFDEYTSTKNKRYMNINIHNKDLDHDKYKNLGLVSIKGSLNAAAGMQYLIDRLQEFDINLDHDIIAFTTDGASVMIKMGKDFVGYHQLCFAHGIQLAVIDVLYKHKYQASAEVSATICTEMESDDDSDDDCEDDGDNHYSNEDCLNILPPTVAPAGLKPDIKKMVKEVRKLVKLFRKSPTKNDALQRYVTEFNNGQTLQLILDCKTRWSSLSDMIGRFLKLKDPIAKVLIDLHIDFPIDDRGMEILENIHKSLAVIKATVLTLCRRDANLLTADAALKFMLKKLDEAKDDLSKNLAPELRKCIKERRTIISGVLQYLHNNEAFYNDDADENTFRKPTGDEIHQTILSLLTRLKYKNIHLQQRITTTRTITQDDNVDDTCDTLQKNTMITIEEELERELENVRVPKPANRDTQTETSDEDEIDLSSIIRVEMCVYDSTRGGREVFLSAAYNYLLSVVPTSVESERAFSSVGYLCNKLRSSLSDKTLNALSFLRSHYQSEQTQ